MLDGALRTQMHAACKPPGPVCARKRRSNAVSVRWESQKGRSLRRETRTWMPLSIYWALVVAVLRWRLCQVHSCAACIGCSLTHVPRFRKGKWCVLLGSRGIRPSSSSTWMPLFADRRCGFQMVSWPSLPKTCLELRRVKIQCCTSRAFYRPRVTRYTGGSSDRISLVSLGLEQTMSNPGLFAGGFFVKR